MSTTIERGSIANKPAYIAILCVLAAVIALQSIHPVSLTTQRISLSLADPLPGDFINVQDKGALGDGSPGDATAITLAFIEAQSKGMSIYFPAGTYNFNNINLTARNNVRIYGDGESTILYNPGSLACYNDVAVENLAIYKSTGVFIHLKPAGYSNLLVDRVKVYNDLPIAEDCRPFYACINELNTNKGVNNVTFTNNSITKCQTGLMLQCEVKSGLIDHNTITKIGTTSVSKQTYGITVGTVDEESNKWICADNIVISNNVIEDIYSPDEPITNVYAILATGYNIQILNNTVKNQVAFTGSNAKVSDLHTGIYAKASDLLIKGNTVTNAGAHSSICVKNNPLRRPDDGRTDNDNIVVEDNYISSSIDAFGGIRFEATNFTVRNNSIKIFAPSDAILDSSGITSRDLPVQWAVIEGNTLHIESRYGIIVGHASGHLMINNNSITQKIPSESISGASLLSLRHSSATTVVDCKRNSFIVNGGRYLLYGVNLVEGGVLNFSGNYVNTKEALINRLFYMDGMTLNMNDNTIISQ